MSDEIKRSIFSCDFDAGTGTIQLSRGKWAGQKLLLRLSCCPSPMCGCTNVAFECRVESSVASQAEWKFSLDASGHSVSKSSEKSFDEASLELATAIVDELDERDWEELFGYFFKEKHSAVTRMDVAKMDDLLPAAPSRGEEEEGTPIMITK